jgi:hypothetical protein
VYALLCNLFSENKESVLGSFYMTDSREQRTQFTSSCFVRLNKNHQKHRKCHDAFIIMEISIVTTFKEGKRSLTKCQEHVDGAFCSDSRVDRELISQNKLSNSVLYRCSMVSMGNMC